MNFFMQWTFLPRRITWCLNGGEEFLIIIVPADDIRDRINRLSQYIHGNTVSH